MGESADLQDLPGLSGNKAHAAKVPEMTVCSMWQANAEAGASSTLHVTG